MVAVRNDGGSVLWDSSQITVHETPRPGIEYASPGGVERADVAAEDAHAAGCVGRTAEDGDNTVAAAGAAWEAEQERLQNLG